MDRHFAAELERIRGELLRMGGLVEGMIAQAEQSVAQRDSERAERVIRHDTEIDRLENKINGACQTLLAIQQPLATDLRFLIAAMQVTNDLERMGDCAGNIAEAALQLNREDALEAPKAMDLLSSETRRMVRSSLDALVGRDADLALSVWRSDDRVDDLHKETFDRLVEVMSSEREAAPRALQLVLVARNLERIADHASNICEEIVFYVTGEEIRHARTRYAPAG